MSESNVLFNITETHLNTGLRGFPVGTVRTSRVSPLEGVSYVGYPIADLAQLDPEAVILGGGIARPATGFSCRCESTSTHCSGRPTTTRLSCCPRNWATSPVPTEPPPTR